MLKHNKDDLLALLKRQRAPIVLVRGPHSCGKLTAVREVAASLGRRVDVLEDLSTDELQRGALETIASKSLVPAVNVLRYVEESRPALVLDWLYNKSRGAHAPLVLLSSSLYTPCLERLSKTAGVKVINCQKVVTRSARASLCRKLLPATASASTVDTIAAGSTDLAAAATRCAEVLSHGKSTPRSGMDMHAKDFFDDMRQLLRNPSCERMGMVRSAHGDARVMATLHASFPEDADMHSELDAMGMALPTDSDGSSLADVYVSSVLGFRDNSRAAVQLVPKASREKTAYMKLLHTHYTHSLGTTPSAIEMAERVDLERQYAAEDVFCPIPRTSVLCTDMSDAQYTATRRNVNRHCLRWDRPETAPVVGGKKRKTPAKTPAKPQAKKQRKAVATILSYFAK